MLCDCPPLLRDPPVVPRPRHPPLDLERLVALRTHLAHVAEHVHPVRLEHAADLILLWRDHDPLAFGRWGGRRCWDVVALEDCGWRQRRALPRSSGSCLLEPIGTMDSTAERSGAAAEATGVTTGARAEVATAIAEVATLSIG